MFRKFSSKESQPQPSKSEAEALKAQILEAKTRIEEVQTLQEKDTNFIELNNTFLAMSKKLENRNEIMLRYMQYLPRDRQVQLLVELSKLDSGADSSMHLPPTEAGEQP